MKPWKSNKKDFHELIINSLKKNTEEDTTKSKKVKGFFDFLKRK
jgi:hypothetical protein